MGRSLASVCNQHLVPLPRAARRLPLQLSVRHGLSPSADSLNLLKQYSYVTTKEKSNLVYKSCPQSGCPRTPGVTSIAKIVACIRLVVGVQTESDFVVSSSRPTQLGSTACFLVQPHSIVSTSVAVLQADSLYNDLCISKLCCSMYSIKIRSGNLTFG